MLSDACLHLFASFRTFFVLPLRCSIFKDQRAPLSFGALVYYTTPYSFCQPPFFPFLHFCPFLTKKLFYTKYYKRNLTKNYSQTLYIIFNLLCISHYTTKIDEDSGSNNFIFIVKRILPVVMYNNIVGIDFSEIR